MKKSFLLFQLIVACYLLNAQPIAKKQVPPALASITEADLKKDLYDLADAHFRGRSAGTIDELKAAMWIAEKYRAIGLKPAGDDGTYFQYFSMWRNRVSDQSTILINNQPLKLWSEAAVAQMANCNIDAPILFVDKSEVTKLQANDVKGKVIAMEADPAMYNPVVSLPSWRYSRSVQAKYGNPLIAKGAIAVIFIADEVGERTWEDATANFKRGAYEVDGGPAMKITTTVPVIWVRSSAKNILQANNAVLKTKISIDHFDYPSVNIIGKIDGTDPVLSKEYLLYSGHTDAHGVRNAINGDSIYYGADDNASIDVAMFATARAFKKNPAKRSVLFVIHGAEERGLLGSKWYAAHSTVPINNIVTVLNADMIGRNHPDSAAVLGTQSPHKNSTELVDMLYQANQEGPQFKLDTLWDKTTHPEGWYFRSDHVPYARLGIPSLMFTTLLHPDYHTPLDNAERIDYAKLKKITEWMYRLGWKVANAPKRPATDIGFKLER
jgi:hypothetical protein